MTGIVELTRRGELDAVAGIAAAVWPATYREILSPEQISYMMRMMYSPEVMARELAEGIRFFLLNVDDAAVGFLSLGPADEPECAKLHKLYLLESLQGRGYGSMMLQFAVRTARESGYRKLHLNVNKHNLRALRAYGRNGFVKLRSEVNPIGSGFVMDDFVMEKIL